MTCFQLHPSPDCSLLNSRCNKNNLIINVSIIWNHEYVSHERKHANYMFTSGVQITEIPDDHGLICDDYVHLLIVFMD